MSDVSQEETSKPPPASERSCSRKHSEFGVAQFAERSRWGATDIDAQTRDGERLGTNESNRLRPEEVG